MVMTFCAVCGPEARASIASPAAGAKAAPDVVGSLGWRRTWGWVKRGACIVLSSSAMDEKSCVAKRGPRPAGLKGAPLRF